VSDALAWDPVAVGHKHPQRRTGVRGKLEASTEFGVDEIGRRAGVEEGDQLLTLDGDVEDHGVLGAYPGERVEGHLGDGVLAGVASGSGSGSATTGVWNTAAAATSAGTTSST
jgi:hypothetical protein